MTSEETALLASKDSSLSLESFSEFVGTGVVQSQGDKEDLLVAVYVSKPRSKLSRLFKAHVPKFVEVKQQDGIVHVATCIIDIGRMEAH